ncbi:GNAT family N-acetyltransferase [Microbacterium sp. PAMC22086]|uniref:GNAT family N-acetyltransferase n=1 Tax=Microbacterium sp. PAMC22086 TaxID=2861281 RepID=UPI001C62F1D4|nr:GNAT family N-acetyltransferase [Microbacterium sp. PAMC22086]QYG11914.1 GNAT family N-acetyltransferase [Microbacterium sp. PAMC22086]
MTSNPLSLPTLSGEKVTLRAWRRADTAVIAEASQDPLIPQLTSVPTTSDEKEALAFIDRQHARLRDRAGYAFAIADHDDNAVGHIGLYFIPGAYGRASAGYWIASSRRRRGFAKDALTALTSWAVTLEELDRVELYVEPWNEGSWRVAEQAGYEREGLLRDWKRVGGQPRDMYMYSWLTRHAI